MRIKRSHTNGRPRLAKIAAALPLLLCALTGCRGALSGDWHMIEAVPNKEVFSLDEVNFARDGGFSATSTIDGRTIREVGTYEFNGFKLTLHPQAGGRRQYEAVLKFRTLEIIDGKHKVVLKKGK